jgi:type IV pilus assembly protein PilA
VIAIILVIAAIAIPNLLRARMAANESSAASAVRTITLAENAYYTAFPTIGFAAQIQHLGRTEPCTPAPTHACLMDDNLAMAVPGTTGHTGYVFLATGINGGGVINGAFVAGATPISPTSTGTRDFCAITDGVIRSQPSTGGLPPNTLGACLAFPIIR